MKKTAKFLICGAALLFGGVLLSSCTASFCSVHDQGNMLYAFDGGVTSYYKEDDIPSGAEVETLVIKVFNDKTGIVDEYEIPNVYCSYSLSNSQGLTAAAKQAYNSGIPGIIYDNTNGKIKDLDPDPEKAKDEANYKYLQYYKWIDNLVLIKELKDCNITDFTKTDIIASTILNYKNTGRQISSQLGRLKFNGNNPEHNNENELWYGYEQLTKEAAKYFYTIEGNFDSVPSTDFRAVYKTQMDGLIRNYRTCLTTIDGFYGSYGEKKQSVYIESKSYQYGWSKGFFDGLLVWPIGGFIDVLATSFGAPALTNGVPQILAIVLVTVIIRLVLVAATFKSTLANAKMTELQPEITKIQNKYPNSKTNNYEKQKMAQDMQALYKKNKINPFSTLIVLIIQFPIFICVWGALSGSAILSSGTFLGLDLSSSISSVLFVGNNWTAAGNYCAVTAFFLFLIMAGAQTVSMLLPQWIQKKKAKQVAKLGKNPSQKSQNNKMKWFTYIMLAMIIFMGFSLVSAMGVYWLIGALFSIAQTLITQAILERKHNKRS